MRLLRSLLLCRTARTLLSAGGALAAHVAVCIPLGGWLKPCPHSTHPPAPRQSCRPRSCWSRARCAGPCAPPTAASSRACWPPSSAQPRWAGGGGRGLCHAARAGTACLGGVPGAWLCRPAASVAAFSAAPSVTRPCSPSHLVCSISLFLLAPLQVLPVERGAGMNQFGMQLAQVRRCGLPGALRSCAACSASAACGVVLAWLTGCGALWASGAALLPPPRPSLAC